MRPDGLNLKKYIIDSNDHLIMWIDSAPGEFSVRDAAPDFEHQFTITQKFEKLVEVGYLERVGRRRGWYRKREVGLNRLDFVNADETPVKIWLPFRLHTLVNIHTGNLIVLAGTPNSGKSACMLNIIRENMDTWAVHYFTSEMEAGELKLRLSKFMDIALDQWTFNAYRRGGEFADVIVPGPGNLNLIDFLEIHDEFYVIAARLKEIHDRLNGAIAIVGLQKNPGADTGLGGWRSMEVTRLAIAMEYQRVKITKAKNYVDPELNPNGMVCNFKLYNGCQITERRDIGDKIWYEERKE